MRAVVATNALELGVDIGALTGCVMVGYPGSISSTWQQAGRAGRSAEASLAVLVASPSPLDQYLVTHPRYFFGRAVEQGLLDPDNLAILTSHLACAAYELPFEAGEPFGGFSAAQELLDLLVGEGSLHRSNGRTIWIDPRKFGRMVLTANPMDVLGDLGPEPLGEELTAGRLEDMLSRRRGRLKPLLLNQHFLAGLGNIYTDESLWRARLHPLRLANTLSREEAERLHGAIDQWNRSPSAPRRGSLPPA